MRLKKKKKKQKEINETYKIVCSYADKNTTMSYNTITWSY